MTPCPRPVGIFDGTRALAGDEFAGDRHLTPDRFEHARRDLRPHVELVEAGCLDKPGQRVVPDVGDMGGTPEQVDLAFGLDPARRLQGRRNFT